MITVKSLNVSPPIEVEYKGRKVTTGIFKKPVKGRYRVNKLNIEGDGQADLLAHGGEMRAVYVYSYDNYSYWEKELGRSSMPFGQFGENLTVEGLLDHEVFVGNQYRIGTALFEVTQPRVPCYKLAMRMEEEGFYSKILESGRLGFYFRVLEEGEIGSGDEIIPVKTEPHELSIKRINSLMYFDKNDFSGFRQALEIEALSPGWRSTFEDRLAKEAITVSEEKKYRSFKVSRREQETPYVTSFYLVPEDGVPLESYLPGQFLPIKLEIPGQYQSVYRTYTISDAPSQNEYRLTIKRELAPNDKPDAYPGISSNYFHDKVKEGDQILAAAPRGKFYLNKEKQNPIVLISGGVGITPMISILNYLISEGSNREVWFIHGARNGEEHIMKKYVTRICDNSTSIHHHFAYSKPLPADIMGEDYQSKGRITLDLISSLVEKDSDFYICGPSRFMTDLIGGLDEWGVEEQNINYEFFGSSDGTLPQNLLKKKRAKEVTACCDDLEIQFSKSDIKANWNPSFDNLLEFIESLGLNPPFSCRSGICQTCSCKVIEGEVEYAEEPLASPGEGNALICCSTPKSSLKLEL